MVGESVARVYAPPPDRGLEIVHEDDSLIVVVKPAGLLSVPGRGQAHQDCMASRVQQRYADALVVHRLDMDTSGLLLMARGLQAQRSLSAAFAQREVHKVYLAVVHGRPQAEQGDVRLPLATDWPNRPRQQVCWHHGKAAWTRYQVLQTSPDGAMSLMRLEPVTGRSHQLRVHMLALGHPIVGDPLYGPALPATASTRAGGEMRLHAQRLSLTHPLSGQSRAWESGPSWQNVPFCLPAS